MPWLIIAAVGVVGWLVTRQKAAQLPPAPPAPPATVAIATVAPTPPAPVVVVEETVPNAGVGTSGAVAASGAPGTDTPEAAPYFGSPATEGTEAAPGMITVANETPAGEAHR